MVISGSRLENGVTDDITVMPLSQAYATVPNEVSIYRSGKNGTWITFVLQETTPLLSLNYL